MSHSRVSADVVSTSAHGYAARVTVRDHQITVDEPEDDGGTDQGPTPTELLLAAAASCYTLALRCAAERRGVRLGNIRVTATGSYEQLRFDRIRLAVSVDFPLGEAAAILRDASRVCYVSNTLAGEVCIDVTVNELGWRTCRTSPATTSG